MSIPPNVVKVVVESEVIVTLAADTMKGKRFTLDLQVRADEARRHTDPSVYLHKKEMVGLKTASQDHSTR